MDVEQKKGEIKADIARGPENVVFSRIDICDEVQLADLMKEQFTPYFRQTARAASGGTVGNATDTLHEVCINLAKQRALLQGAAVTDVMNFSIADESTYATSGGLSLPDFQDSSYSNKTSFGYLVLHDVNKTGGSITLSSVSNANTSIIDDDGNAIKYFTDFSKYFLTRSRANGEIISIDENTAPYMVPTISEPFIPTSTINGEIFRGTAPAPTANSDVRYEFGTAANTSGGNAGGDLDIVENKWAGNTFVTIEISDVVGTFATSETISDYDLNTATIKTYANTTSVFLEGQNSKGTFVVDELVSDLSTNATISTIFSLSDTEKNLTLTGSTFITGSNTDITLGFDTSNTISLDTGAVSRSGGTVTVIANSHGISPGERIALKGADTEYSEFNDTFIVEDTTSNTFTFTTSNTTSVTPTGDFSLVDNIVFGRTSNASMSIFKRTANSSAQIVFQSDDLSAGFPIANTITGSSFGATGSIDSRVVGGAWYQTKTNEVKTFFSNSTIGTWDYDATNNPVGIPAAANAGAFWLQNFEPVKINQIIAGTNAGTINETAPKMVLDIAIAVSGQAGGYDTSINTKLPGIYFAYPLKTYADQVHDGVTTLNAYESFANVITAPEGLEINFDWLPLSQDAAGNKTGADIATTGLVGNTASHGTDKVTILSKANFEAHLGPYGGADASPIDDVFRSTNPDTRSSGVKVGTTGAVYPSVNANPFFPAVSPNTSFSATGYSAPYGANTANNIFAGSYTAYQKDMIEPAGDYRYVIQNDLKWVYAVDPFGTGSTAAASLYNKPQGGAFQEIYDGYTAQTRDTTWAKIANNYASHGKTSHASSATSVGATVAGVCTTHPTHVNNTANTYVLGTIGTHSGILTALDQTCNDTSYCDVDGSGHTDSSTCGLAHTGHWVAQCTWSTTTPVEFPCLYNRAQWFLTANGANIAKVTSGTTAPSNMQTELKVLYKLLLDLIYGGTHNVDYEDPLCDVDGEHPDGGSYGGAGNLGRSDSSFEQETENMKSAIDALLDRHSTIKGSIASNTNLSYNSTFTNVITEIGTYKDVIKRRITEISNRIGYLNSKDVAGGGYNQSISGLTIAAAGSGYTAGTLTASGGSGSDFAGTFSITADGCPTSIHSDASTCNADTSSSGHSGGGANWVTTGPITTALITDIGAGYTSTPTINIVGGGSGTSGSITATVSSITKSLDGTATYQGFEGYSFNGGNGYANTVYSHANFLGGKKINLLGKVLKAIVGVQAMYDSITTKRSEYYEYNQAS